MKKSFIAFALMLTASVTLAKDIKTVVVTTTPQMHCENCEKKIKGNLRFEKGVKRIETNIPNQTVTIQYDADKTDVAKQLKGFEKFGYTARTVKDGEKKSENKQPTTTDKH